MFRSMRGGCEVVRAARPRTRDSICKSTRWVCVRRRNDAMCYPSAPRIRDESLQLPSLNRRNARTIARPQKEGNVLSCLRWHGNVSQRAASSQGESASRVHSHNDASKCTRIQCSRKREHCRRKFGQIVCAIHTRGMIIFLLRAHA